MRIKELIKKVGKKRLIALGMAAVMSFSAAGLQSYRADATSPDTTTTATGEDEEAPADASPDIDENNFGVYVFWEWERMTSVSYDRAREDAFEKKKPMAMMLVPVNGYGKPLGQAVSIYADKSHLYRTGMEYMSKVGMNGGVVSFHSDIIKLLNFIPATAYRPFNGKPEEAYFDQFDSLYMVNDEEGASIGVENFSRQKFITSGNCKGCLWMFPLVTNNRLVSCMISQPSYKVDSSDMSYNSIYNPKVESSYWPADGIPYTYFDQVLDENGKPTFTEEGQKNQNIYWASEGADYGAMKRGFYLQNLPVLPTWDTSEDKESLLLITGSMVFNTKMQQQYDNYNNSHWNDSGLLKLENMPVDYASNFTYLPLDPSTGFFSVGKAANVFQLVSGGKKSEVYHDGKDRSYDMPKQYIVYKKGTIFGQNNDGMKKLYKTSSDSFDSEIAFGYMVYKGTTHVYSAIQGVGADEKGRGGVYTVKAGGTKIIKAATYRDLNGTEQQSEGIIIPEGTTLVLEEGATLSVEGGLINNGKIINKGGTIMIKDGGAIFPFCKTDEGTIECQKGEKSGQAGDIVIMEGGRLYCFTNADTYSDPTATPALSLSGGATVINYGSLVASYILADSKSRIENRKDGIFLLGYNRKDVYSLLYTASVSKTGDATLERISAAENTFNPSPYMTIEENLAELYASLKSAGLRTVDYENGKVTVVAEQSATFDYGPEGQSFANPELVNIEVPEY